MRPYRRAVLALLLLALALSSCGGLNESGPAGTGHVSIALTDAPSYAFDNVWVTLRGVWFHKVETAAFDSSASGWTRFNFDNGVTVNLAALAGDNNVVTVFDNLALPAGTYRQMLLFLEPTENARLPSATARGLAFNNQVDAGSLRAALRVPNAAQGIRIADRTFQVDNGALLRLAIDFDIGRDVLPFNRGAVREFLLQPRPRSFDLGNAGAIVGFIDNTAASDNTAFFEVLAEQVDTGLNAHVVRRVAAIDNTTGKFVLYPLEPGTTTGQRYDLVIRAIGWQTVIVKEVPVTRGTTPISGATTLGTLASRIPMFDGSDYLVAAGITGTSGALAKFYQNFAGDVPYVVRQANFDPLSGRISGFPLSDNQVRVDPYSVSEYGVGPISIDPVLPVGGNGAYALVGEAPLYNPSGSPVVGVPVNPLSAANPFTVTGLTPTAPAVQNMVHVTATAQLGVGPMDNVVFFATFGGTILNVQALTSVPDPAQVTPTITNLPGGSFGSLFTQASYGVSAYGWRTSVDNVLRIGTPATLLAKPQADDVTVSLTMTRVTAP